MTGPRLAPAGVDATSLVDDRSGFSALIPAADVTLSATEIPLREHVATVAEPAVEVGLRVDAADPGPAPDARAEALARAFAEHRSAGVVEVRVAGAAQRDGWRADGAASALYLRPGGTLRVTPMEEILVLLRGAWVVSLTRRFDGQGVDSVTWALFAGAMNAHLGWAVAPVASPWPDSAWLLPGAVPRFTEAAKARILALAPTLATPPKQAAEIVVRLYALARGVEDPARVATPAEVASFVAYLDLFDDAAPSAALAADLETVRTARDLRGVALVWLQAARRAGFGAPG